MSDDREARVRLELYAQGYMAGLKDAERQAKEFSRNVAGGMKGAKDATNALGDAQRLGGERMAKYTTVVGQATGGLRAMGVQNELVARGMGVTMDILTGMTGTLGLVLVGVGAVGAAIGYLVQKHKEWDAAVKTSSENLLDFMKTRGITSDVGGMIVQRQIRELTAERQQLEAQLADLRKRAHDAMFVPAPPWKTGNLVAIASDRIREFQELESQGAVLQDRLNKVGQSLYELWTISEGGAVKGGAAKSGEEKGLAGALRLKQAEVELAKIHSQIREVKHAVFVGGFLLDAPGKTEPLIDVLGNADEVRRELADLQAFHGQVMQNMMQAAQDAAMGSSEAWINFAQQSISIGQQQAARYLQIWTESMGAIGGTLFSALGGGLIGMVGGFIGNIFRSGSDRGSRLDSRMASSVSSGNSSNLRGAADANRPLTVQYIVNTTVNGPVVGPQGMDELVDSYIIPRLAPATALGQAG